MTAIAERASPEPLLTRSFAALLLAQAGFGYSFSSFFLLPKFLAAELGAGPTQIGLVMGAYGVAAIPGIPLMGALVDRHGRRNFLTAGAAVMALSALAFAAVDEIGPLVYVLRAVQGLAFAMAFSAGAALAVDLAPASRVAQAIGLFGATFLSMNAIAPAVAEELSARAGWPTAFGTAAAGAVLCTFFSRRVPDEHAPPAPEDATTLWSVLRRPSQIRLNVVIALVGTAMCAMFIYHQPFALDLGIENVRAFFVAYAVVAVSLRVALGHQVDRIGHRRVAIGALVLYAPVVAGMAKLDVLGLPILGAGLGLAHGLLYPSLNAVAVAEAGENERGKVMASFQAAFNIGFSGALPFLGLLASSRGYPEMFVVAALCAFAAFVLFVLSPEGRMPR